MIWKASIATEANQPLPVEEPVRGPITLQPQIARSVHLDLSDEISAADEIPPESSNEVAAPAIEEERSSVPPPVVQTSY